MKCTKQVGKQAAAPYCGKHARWLVAGFPRCSSHARKNDWYVKKYGRVPITQEAEK